VDLYYIYYYVWPNVYWKISSSTSWFNSIWQFQSIAKKKEVVGIKVKKLEIKYLSNSIISVVYYICMLYIKNMVYNNC
jgi:hypothetical protein